MSLLSLNFPFSSLRQSSISRAPRGRFVSARKSSGGRSLSLQVASSLMRRAQTRPQTAMGPTTVHCHEFIPDALHALHLHKHTHKHTRPHTYKMPNQSRAAGGDIPTALLFSGTYQGWMADRSTRWFYYVFFSFFPLHCTL